MEEYPQCPICSDIFGNYDSHIRAPKILKCGDNICKECLEKAINDTKEDFFYCPICKEKIKKEENIDDYITNRDFIKIIDACFIISEKAKTGDLDNDNSIKYNIVLLGNVAVGKTSIFNRLSLDVFSEMHLTTLGNFSTKYYVKYKGINYQLTFHDPAGQETFKAVTKSILRNIDGVLFIFDLTNKQSFDDLESWYDFYKEEKEIVVGLLIGNKCDLEHKVVNEKEAEKFVKNHKLKKYLEVSAKLDKKIKKAVAYLLEEIMKSKKFDNNPSSADKNVSLKKGNSKNKKNCEC